MKKCEKCNKYFITYFKDETGKNHNLCNRKYCFDCSPWKLHNTKNLLNSIKKDLDISCVCKYCNKNYIHNRNIRKGSNLTTCNSCITAINRFKLKKRMLDYKGNCCSICGYKSNNPRNLVFHHISDKKFELSDSYSYIKAWETIKTELDKCILVCQHCHNDIHVQQDGNLYKKFLDDGLI